MRLLFAAYLAWLSSLDEAELHERCIDGSASTEWAVMVRHQIDTRTRRIHELRRPRLAPLKARA